MSTGSTDEPPEEMVDTENVGGLEEILPEWMMPLWSRVQLIQDFRDTHGETYVAFIEAIIAIVLTGGYLYWLTLYVGG
ncbi:hypothetical protein [Natrinema salaciae]|uniref:Uncharacterized protein n=1 Tax=Natrinema salaciae TaxID=1186196 RepID=A0A1H9BIH9_9EURY|nr:hypothetical protein [Natrinema salaciae]SEP88705.1 hypothetical protein SAMN04489841_0758 [Natrinema salaciae]